VHRDIKPANLLLNATGLLQIGDFGSARKLPGATGPHSIASTSEMTQMVVTRWYRAPELLMGDDLYGQAVDLWSVG
jgi:serine/threonine protein kinase